MSFLAGRLAGKEAAYFVQESRQAVSRLRDKLPPSSLVAADSQASSVASPDVLPEVLRHSLPPKLYHQQPLSDYSSPTSASTKWSIHSSPPISNSDAALNPLRGYLSFPQVTFGPRRWQMPEAGASVTASTANELRRGHYTPANPEKLKAAAQGLAHIGKAFVVATVIIFGSAAMTFGMAASKLQVHNSDDIKTKGRDLVQPKVESFRERLAPLRNWVDQVSKKWHMEMEQGLKDKPIIKELSQSLRGKHPSN